MTDKHVNFACSNSNLSENDITTPTIVSTYNTENEDDLYNNILYGDDVIIMQNLPVPLQQCLTQYLRHTMDHGICQCVLFAGFKNEPSISDYKIDLNKEVVLAGIPQFIRNHLHSMCKLKKPSWLVICVTVLDAETNLLHLSATFSKGLIKIL